eukprot:TRINITY_DN915_c0_g1_i2.p1 TRINITY_DN915_c0_g1~~TRINITY_DN915_c0_g1_i2.p1  ORF type:complete len:126 (+),score=23.43 TRINITY_DN915_c0_g1_i2:114-491(+)
MSLGLDVCSRKLFISQLLKATPLSQTSYRFGKVEFSRVWLQGVVVQISSDDEVWIDDGTGVAKLFVKKVLQINPLRFFQGQYLLVVGIWTEGVLAVQKMVDLSDQKDREALWMLEVVDASQKFYY